MSVYGINFVDCVLIKEKEHGFVAGCSVIEAGETLLGYCFRYLQVF